MNFIQRIKNKLFVELNPWFRNHVIIPRNKHLYKGAANVTLLCNNCIGGVIFHELGLKFMSPTVNLWIKPKDFIKYCSNLKHYSQCKLEFLDCSLYLSASEKYPVACLDDIIIYFLHYTSEEDARQKWEERTNRINYDNVRCILSERDGCTFDDLENFSKLPYPTASLVHCPVSGIPNTCYIRGFEDEIQLGNIMEFKKGQYFGRKYFDDFEFVKFLMKQ